MIITAETPLKSKQMAAYQKALWYTNEHHTFFARN
jgi:hypothetical protein